MLYAGTKLIVGLPVDSAGGFARADVCEVWSPSRNRRVGAPLMVTSIQRRGVEHDLLGIELRPPSTPVSVGNIIDIGVFLVKESNGSSAPGLGNAAIVVELLFNWNPLDLRLLGINNQNSAPQLISSSFPIGTMDMAGVNEANPPADGTAYYSGLALGFNPITAISAGTRVTSLRFEVLRSFQSTQVNPIVSVQIPNSTDRVYSRVLDAGTPGYESTGNLRGAIVTQGSTAPSVGAPVNVIPGTINVTLSGFPFGNNGNDFIANGDVFRKITNTAVSSAISGPFQTFTDNLNETRSGRGFIEPNYNPARHDLFNFNSNGTVVSASPINTNCLSGTNYSPDKFNYTGLVFTSRTNAPRGHWNGLGSRVGVLLTRQHIWFSGHYPIEGDSVNACTSTQLFTRAKRGKWEQNSTGSQFEPGNGYMTPGDYPAWYLAKTGRSVETDHPEIGANIWNTFGDVSIQVLKTPFPASVTPFLMPVSESPSQKIPFHSPMVVINNSWLTASFMRGVANEGPINTTSVSTINSAWSNLPTGASLNDMTSVPYLGDSGSVILYRRPEGTVCMGMGLTASMNFGITVSSNGVYQSCSNPPFSGSGSCTFEDKLASSNITTGTSVFSLEHQLAIDLMLADKSWQITPLALLSTNSQKNITESDIVETHPNWLFLDEPTSSLDYKVWAFGFFNESTGGMFASGLSPALAWNTPTYSLHSLVPMIGLGSNVYNGYREPGTDPPSSGTPGPSPLQEPQFSPGFSTFKSRMLTVPEGRRAINMYYWWPDISIFTKKHYNFYKDTLDGTTFNPNQLTGPGAARPAEPGSFIPQNDRILTPWLDTNLLHNKQSTRAFLQRCINENLTFDYFIDDKEAQDIFWINGRNTYLGAWGDRTGNSPYPTDLQPTREYGPQMPDARFASAIAADSRFTTYQNPRTGMTFAQEFLANYKLIANKPNETRTWKEILDPLINVPIPTGFIPYNAFWVPWGSSANGTNTVPGWWPTGTTQPDGYDLFHHVAPAWNATADAWHFNYYIDEAFLKVCKEFPQFQNVKFSQYETYPISHEDALFKIRSNGEPYLSKAIPEWYVGASTDYYGDPQNILYTGGKSFYPGPIQNRVQWLENHAYRSGYVNNPVTDAEKYSWRGFYQTTYNGPAGNTNLVKYPEANPWVNEQYSVNEQNKFYRELCYKTFVNGVMRTRFGLRADPTVWQRLAPWITPPSYYNAPYTLANSVGLGYWYEVVYHLCVSGARFFNVFSDLYGANLIPVNDALNEWRKASRNSRAIPCSNATGDINLPIERVIIHNAFNGVLISGGKLEETGKYIWRITVPPKFFNLNGTCVLKRQGTSSDIPEFITINSSADVKNAFGAWVTRDVSTPPDYAIFGELSVSMSASPVQATFDANGSLSIKKAVNLTASTATANSDVQGTIGISSLIRLGRAAIENSLTTFAELDGVAVVVPNAIRPALDTYSQLAMNSLNFKDIDSSNCVLGVTAQLNVSPSANLSVNFVNTDLEVDGALTILKLAPLTSSPIALRMNGGAVIEVVQTYRDSGDSNSIMYFTNSDNISTIENSASESVDTFLFAKNMQGYDEAVIQTDKGSSIDLDQLGLVATNPKAN